MKVKFIKIDGINLYNKIALSGTYENDILVFNHSIDKNDVDKISEKIMDIRITNVRSDLYCIDINRVREVVPLDTHGNIWPLDMIDSIISIEENEYVPPQLKKLIFEKEMNEILSEGQQPEVE